jgi:TonB-linked SusC/RagA family outer membrane protein
VGTEEKSNYSRELGGKRTGYASNSPAYRFLSTGRPTGLTNYSFGSTSYLYSFLSQVEYSYQEKYFLRATMRGDESSVFGSENRLGWFPAVSAAWRLTEEDFLRNIEWLKDLKLRGSWGKTGFDGNTDPSNQYTLYGGGAGASYYDIFGNNVGNIDQGFRPIRFGNARTSWQEDIVTNIGLDAVFWNGEFSVTADWYNKNSTGLLFPLSLPALLGEATPPNVNVGDVKNYGIDLTIGSKGRFSKNSGWDLLLTFSHYDNKIVKLNDVPFFDQMFGIVRNEVGYPISSFFGYEVIGFFEDDADVAKSPTQTAAAPGRFKYLDANGDHKITSEDRVHFGNPNPKFTLGLNLGFHYANFDFATFFYGSFGNDIFNTYRSRMDIYGGPHSKTALYDSWTPGHHNAAAPIAEISSNFSNGGSGGVPNSYDLEKGSYFRNKTMIIGYSLPKSLLQKLKIERFRIYIQAVNLFTVTNYSGLDPELSGGSSAFGIDLFGNYPNNQKQYLVGFNLGF